MSKRDSSPRGHPRRELIAAVIAVGLVAALWSLPVAALTAGGIAYGAWWGERA